MNKIRLSLTTISFFAIAVIAQEDKPSSLPLYMPQSVMSPKVLEFVENSARSQSMAIKRTYKYDALGRHIRSGVQTIATSTAQQDVDKFDFNFSKEKFSPFEGAGADNMTWRLTIPDITGIDVANIILYISYTARKG